MTPGQPPPPDASSDGQFRFDVGYRVSLVLDPHGIVRAVAEISGLGDVQPEAFLGRPVLEISAQRGSGQDGAAIWAERLAEVTSGSTARHFADRPPETAPNTPPSIDSTLTPVRRADGTLEAILMVVEDRTGFFRTQRRLHDSEQRFRSLAESLPQMVWTSSLAGQVDYFSPRWEQFTGRRVEELLGDGYEDLIHPDDLPMVYAAKGGKRWDRPLAFRLRRHDGVYRTMEAFIEPVRGEDGRPTRWVGGTVDITERRIAEDHSRELQEQLRTALLMTGLGRFTIELRPPAITGDDRVTEILGLTPSNLIVDESTRELFDDVHPDDRDRVRGAFEATISGGPDFDQEYRILRPTEGEPEERWIAVAGRTEFDDEGPLRIFGVIEDITDRHRADESRLRTQKREAIGTLAGGIAHDFNNVIGAILSNAALAETELDVGESPRESVAEIRRGAGRAADLVRRMLAISREDEPNRESVDLADIAREACALLRPTLPSSTRVDIAVESTQTVVLGDATQLHQVVMNLVTNAGQAIGEDGGVIRLQIDESDGAHAIDGPPGPHLRLQVRDDGPGMPEEVRRRAFDPFFTTKAPGEGTGLGLAASQTIVRSHGGTISIDSVAGAHTTVTVLIPAVHAMPLRPRPQPTAAGRPPNGLAGTPPRVLFVDDELALANLAERAMPAYGCSATAFTDPSEALGAFAAAPESYDALVTDLSMPGLSGLELSEKIRELRPELPVVLTSGFLTADNEAEAKRQGVDAIVVKPCSMDDLTSAVLRLVD